MMNPLKSIQQGMDVFDSSGEKVGSVKNVKMGDPQAVTAQGQDPASPDGLFSALANALGGGSGLPEERRERLLRLGYLEINGTGPGNHFYESAEAVDRVTDEGVHLNSSAAGTSRA
ncbi:PRC-barrel domain-containing protein [Arthrobacter zhaoguopingii]|uniref:PRC-barrel domain-containing protein n=1 Tax=Arthrobacter zhaoguopingii TaxID=2681491 RepID=UPI00135970D4|nr:PRC-barrel domain-containing protein [Arthrobacter zhaoguopingii]